MTRQQRLMGSLGPPPVPKATRHPAWSEEQRAAHSEAETRAIEDAFSSLALGKLDAALALLLPYADNAQDTRTLTTLARIRSMQGDFDAAFGYLKLAEAIDRADPKVLYFTAELLKSCRRYGEELMYRRRAAFTKTDAPIETFVSLITAVVKATPKGQKLPLSEIKVAWGRVKAAAELPPALRIEAARSAFGVPSLQSEALAMYEQADPCSPLESNVVAHWKTLRDYCAQRPHTLHSIGAFGEPGRRPLLAELNDGILLPAFQWMPLLDQGSVALSGLAASRVRVRSEDPHSPLLMAGPHKAVFRLQRELPRVEEPVIILGGTGHYYHDLVEYGSALAIPETLGLAGEAKLLVNGTLAPHQLEMFGLLGVKSERLLRWDPTQPVRIDRFWLPTRLAAGGRWFDPLLAHWYRQRLAPLLSAGPPHRKLYLSRSATSRRRIQNEAEVLEVLTPVGFECVRPETLSVREQIALFSQASHIVGPSGAAMTNMLFAPAGAHVVVLLTRHLVNGGGDAYFDALAQSCNHKARIEACEPVRLTPGKRAIDADVVVDIAKLLEALS